MCDFFIFGPGSVCCCWFCYPGHDIKRTKTKQIDSVLQLKFWFELHDVGINIIDTWIDPINPIVRWNETWLIRLRLLWKPSHMDLIQYHLWTRPGSDQGEGRSSDMGVREEKEMDSSHICLQCEVQVEDDRPVVLAPVRNGCFGGSGGNWIHHRTPVHSF